MKLTRQQIRDVIDEVNAEGLITSEMAAQLGFQDYEAYLSIRPGLTKMNGHSACLSCFRGWLIDHEQSDKTPAQLVEEFSKVAPELARENLRANAEYNAKVAAQDDSWGENG